MRILVVSHSPLVRELGEAQIALSLAEELEAQGHDVETWSPESAPPGAGRRPAARRALEELVARGGRFDLIDAPADLISTRVAAAGLAVARSVQPELLYRKVEVAAELRWRPLSPRSWIGLLRSARTAARIMRGWRCAAGVICLGACEAAWMRERFPSFADRISSYRAAPGNEDRARFRDLRKRRTPDPRREQRRFLWIGRWSAHKGVAELTEYLARLNRGDSVTLAGCGREGEVALSRLDLPRDRVHVVPTFTRADLPALLAEHTAGLFTSRVEGWGLSLQEMLESGLPVFATRAGCVPDLEPYLGSLLGCFPPDEGQEPVSSVPIDWNAYEEAFSWPVIARDYLRSVERFRAATSCSGTCRAGTAESPPEPGP